jgi:putative hydrolase of the HAD superfamily
VKPIQPYETGTRDRFQLSHSQFEEYIPQAWHAVQHLSSTHPARPGALYNQCVNSPTRIVRHPANQTLLIDADDTLWENNIYFERAITSFISYLDHRIHTAEEVRGHLNRVEHDTIRTHGYGLHSFRRSLVACFEQLSDVPMTDEKHRRIESFAQSIAEQEIELLPSVAPTLNELAMRHRLILVTKGDQDEQTDKLHRSGLAPHFTAVEVLPEKHHEAYLSLASHHGCEACNTWMVGNSPRSDVNPALSAGLNAIFIPHDFTWVLEHEVVNQPPVGQQLLELASFADLTRHF